MIPILSEPPFCDEEVFPSRSLAIIWPSGSGRSDESVSFSQHKRQAIVEFCGSLVEIAWDVDQSVSFVRELLGELRRRRILMPLMRRLHNALVVFKPRASDLSRTTDDWVSLELMNRRLFFIQPGHVTATGS